MNNLWGIVASLIYIGLVLGASTLVKRLGAEQETSRKLAHVALSGWWLVAMAFFTSPWWAAVVPALFVGVNAWALKRGSLSAIGRAGDTSPGTVYYAISLLLLALFCFGVAEPYMGALGVFCMGLGDGFAAVFGTAFGNKRLYTTGSGKSYVGSAAMLVISYLVCSMVLLGYATLGDALIYAIPLALLATLLEATSLKGLDNLTVPLGVTGFYYAAFAPGAVYRAPVLGALLSLGVVLVAWHRGLLTLPAGLGAVLVGAALYAFGGPALWLLLIWFFTSSTLATRLLAHRLPGCGEGEHSPRRLRQVLANSLPATACALGHAITGNGWLLVVAAAALAACTADTWASEIGVYSRKSPVNILTRKPMQRGLSGGVSPLGLGASAAAALLTALLAMVLLRWLVPGVPTGPQAFLLVAAGGMAGSLLDSVLGVLLQAKYSCAGVAQLYEKRPQQAEGVQLVSGLRWVTNDVVNLLSGALVSALGLLLFV